MYFNGNQLKIKKKLPIPMKSSDEYEHSSEENQDSPRKRIFKSLSLTSEQLMDRLNTLKDYPTYKKTKAKRIDLKSISQSQGAPIITAALSYGNRNNHNEVLMEYIEQGQGQAKFQQIHTEIHHKKGKMSLKSDPSFLNYKKIQENEKNKIYRMINASHPHFGKQKVIKQEKKNNQHEQNGSLKFIMPFPKELSKLKNKLKLLPIVKENQSSVNNLPNPQIQEMNTLSISSHAYGTITIEEKQQQKTNIKMKHSFDFSERRGRNYYLKQLKNILEKSVDFNNYTKQGKDKFGLRSSCQSDMQMLCKSDIHLNVKSKINNIKYWPNYSQYCLTQNDEKKLDRLKVKAGVLSPNHPGLPEEVRELEQKIKQQIEQQQHFIEKDLINNEGNVLGSKFSYLFNLQKQNYKKNVQGLIKCRKQYRIERQKQEIRANGLKRMKKMGVYEITKKKYEKKEKIDQQIY